MLRPKNSPPRSTQSEINTLAVMDNSISKTQLTNVIKVATMARKTSSWRLKPIARLGWETGFEPATFGATVRRSTN